jgi:hypothetical protein
MRRGGFVDGSITMADMLSDQPSTMAHMLSDQPRAPRRIRFHDTIAMRFKWVANNRGV